MNKLLEVREFECITCNDDYKDDRSFKYLEKELFNELEEFILQSKGRETEVSDFLNIRFKRNVGKIIQAKNYVGLIQMKNGFNLQILPKISYNSINDTKKIFIKMLRSLKVFNNKIFNDANLRVDKMNLYEIFINMYIQELRNLVKRGIKSSYLLVENNNNFYKGKLLTSEHIKRNFLHKERFYIGYDEFLQNCPENKLIKSTLLKLQKISTSAYNIKEIKQLLINFENVEPSKNYIKDFSKVVINRNTKYYELLMKWSKVFLMNYSFTTFSGNTKSRALLFPMEKIFESYVAKNLKKALEDLNWNVSRQDKGCYLFDEPRKFALRPDIVVTRDDGSIIVLDTKWKSLINKMQQNYGISQGDMYQMYAYSKKYKTAEIWLLYPVNEEMKDAGDIKFKSIENDDKVLVRLFFVDVGRIEESMRRLREELNR
ncbi:McrC family protein [Clostridium oceanicum]|uniref:McrC family protein n=1 Tax=Clostridium oceanicum TaxID=1543 RepID=A0ABN1JG16_9CLOT